MSKSVTIEFIKEVATDHGYECLSNTYVSADSKLEFRRPNGEIYWTTWHIFRHKKTSKNFLAPIPTIEVVKEYAQNYGFKCLEDNYINGHTGMRFECSKGHLNIVNWNDFYRSKTSKKYLKGNYSYRCSTCYRRNIDLNYIKELAQLDGTDCVSASYNYDTKLSFICNKGHHYDMHWRHFLQGSRCKICAHKQSKAEFEIIDFIKEFYNGKIIHGDRKTIVGISPRRYFLELDIYLPELNIAIEFNGFMHRYDFRSMSRDIVKIAQCEYKKIDLIVVEDDRDWCYGWTDQKNVHKKERTLKKIKDLILSRNPYRTSKITF